MNVYYSKITDIFYAKYNNVLYRFSAYHYKKSRKLGKKINIEWTESDFKDIEGMSSNWIKATDRQIVEFDLDRKFKEMLTKRKV